MSGTPPLDWTQPDRRPFFDVEVGDDRAALTWRGHAGSDFEAEAMALADAAMAWRICAKLASRGKPIPRWLGVVDDCRQINPLHDEVTPSLAPKQPIADALGVTRRIASGGNPGFASAADKTATALLRAAAATAARPPQGKVTLTFGAGSPGERSYYGLTPYQSNWRPVGQAFLPEPLRRALAACAVLHWAAGTGYERRPERDCVVGDAGSATLRAAEQSGLLREAPANFAAAQGLLRKLGLASEADALAAYVAQDFLEAYG